MRTFSHVPKWVAPLEFTFMDKSLYVRAELLVGNEHDFFVRVVTRFDPHVFAADAEGCPLFVKADVFALLSHFSKHTVCYVSSTTVIDLNPKIMDWLLLLYLTRPYPYS